ncbi:MAG: sulfotransferase [Steroidobacteraceae bacterium]
MASGLLDMNEASFLAAAIPASGGLTEYGDESFREPLRILIASIRDEARMNPQGLFGWQQRTLQLLTLRLQMQDLVRRHPEILHEPIERPLIMVSMQRTGSTKLQKMLGCDEYWNAPLFWEILFPVPFPGEKAGDPTPRIAAAKEWLKMFYAGMPEARSGHAMVAEETDEETFAVEMSFRWTVASIHGMIPSYIRWVEEHTAVPTYQDLKRVLQALQWQRGIRKPWLLKAPWHIGFLDSIMKVFPDATVVQCHRDPFESVPSNCALMYLGRRVGRPTLSKLEHGADVLAMMGRQMATHLQQRDALGDKDSTIDVHYKDIVGDAIGVARKIYAARGETLDADAEQSMRDWERDNAQYKHGKFEYTAEEYGITRESVAAAFAHYYKRFPSN